MLPSLKQGKRGKRNEKAMGILLACELFISFAYNLVDNAVKYNRLSGAVTVKSAVWTVKR